ncbi:Smr/MutS family protein [Acetobacter musti]
MRRRTMREEERELWARFARGVKPLVQAGAPKIPPATTTPPARQDAVVPSGSGLISGPDSAAGFAPAARVPERRADRQQSAPVALSGGTMSFLTAGLTAGEIAVAAHLRKRVVQRRRKALPSEALQIGSPQAGLDTGSWKRLSRGQTQVERRLDLHGMTAQAAFLRLREFLTVSHREGVRCVEIVTGLGSGPEGGILRRELPFWLGRDDLRRLVLAVTHAHDANRGAVRVLLRRRSGARR